jgi:hypothetical protein
MISKGIKIEPAHGKLGVVLPGMGAVTSTFIAGVEAIKKGLAKPIGSLTQMGTIRLGKRSERRVPAAFRLINLSAALSISDSNVTTNAVRWRRRGELQNRRICENSHRAECYDPVSHLWVLE